MGESGDSTGKMQTLAFSFVKSVIESSDTTIGQIITRAMEHTHQSLVLEQASSNEGLLATIRKRHQL